MYLPSLFVALLLLCAAAAAAAPEPSPDRRVTPQLFAELEELARLVDIAYCVGTTGIRRPFACLSRCGEFPGFELVDTWNTGPLLSDSCGYIALDTAGERVVVAFRGTHSLANAIVDLTTVPQAYVPYPGGDPDDPDDPQRRRPPKCANCTVHAGFLASWRHTRPIVLPHLARLRAAHPRFAVHLVGHSLGGAVAALAGLEMAAGHPEGGGVVVTTFGEPRVGNEEFVGFLDGEFGLAGKEGGEKDGGEKDGGEKEGGRFRRVTHRDDPVPLLPLAEWGYRMHAGEIYIAKRALAPEVGDLQLCVGDADLACIAGAEEGAVAGTLGGELGALEVQGRWGIQRRFRLWQLLFAHRDYFWRLGLCVPGGDPVDWGRWRWRGRGGGEL